MPLLCAGLCRWFVLRLFCLQAAQQLQNGIPCFLLDLLLALLSDFRLQELLLHAGYAQIYDWVPRDSILFYALDNGMSLVACNQQLDERGEAILG